jgi:glucuronate isomerase
MKTFMGGDFLLATPSARHLYHDYAERLPIIDYHCHIPPKEIYEDRRFENIAQVWLGGRRKTPDGRISCFGDHYKWRLMRADGVPEDYITGEQPDKERFRMFCRTLEKTIGNPMNHWCQLELQKYFDIRLPICQANADQIWEQANDRLQNDPACTCRGLIAKSNVYFIGTTDDPADPLEWHALLQKDPSFKTITAPSFRPDKAMNIAQPGFASYMEQLSRAAGLPIGSAGDVLTALAKRLDFFVEMGCRAADHGLGAVPHSSAFDDEKRAEEVFQKAMAGKALTEQDSEDWQSWLLYHLSLLYAKKHVVLQLHYNALRNTNRRYYQLLGPDTGFDGMDTQNCIRALAGLLSDLTEAESCPRTILYSLNPEDFDALAVLAGCFQADGEGSRIQLGAPWWFNDTRDGMERQLKIYGRLGVLGNFIGMLTDSRSFLSYTRHEYFRRILCNVIGGWVENGEFPNDEAMLKTIVEGICFFNAKAYFSL